MVRVTVMATTAVSSPLLLSHMGALPWHLSEAQFSGALATWTTAMVISPRLID